MDDYKPKSMIEIIKEAGYVMVVRCKYCRHSVEWYGDKRRCFLWNENGIDVFEDGYCSYGRPKEGK